MAKESKVGVPPPGETEALWRAMRHCGLCAGGSWFSQNTGLGCCPRAESSQEFGLGEPVGTATSPLPQAQLQPLVKKSQQEGSEVGRGV